MIEKWKIDLVLLISPSLYTQKDSIIYAIASRTLNVTVKLYFAKFFRKEGEKRTVDVSEKVLSETKECLREKEREKENIAFHSISFIIGRRLNLRFLFVTECWVKWCNIILFAWPRLWVELNSNKSSLSTLLSSEPNSCSITTVSEKAFNLDFHLEAFCEQFRIDKPRETKKCSDMGQ